MFPGMDSLARPSAAPPAETCGSGTFPDVPATPADPSRVTRSTRRYPAFGSTCTRRSIRTSSSHTVPGVRMLSSNRMLR